MIEDPVSRSDADYVKNVYETGLREGEKLAQTGDRTALVTASIVAGGAAIVTAVAFARSRREKEETL